jgi:hypothetical protein
MLRIGERVEMELEKFWEEYFGLIKKVNEFHFNYLVTNKFKFPKTNYLELKRFIDTATNFLLDLDRGILNGLAGKLHQDIESLYEFYKEFLKKTKYAEMVFYQEYLENLDNYKALKDEYDQLKKSIEEYNHTISSSEEKLKTMKESDPSYKKLKKLYVDSIYELSKNKDRFYEVKKSLENIEKTEELRFFPKFNKLKEMHVLKLEKILNCKLYYFDKLLWYNASKSQPVIDFFVKSNIEGDFCTKTFIDYSLKNIDVSKSHNSEWIMYLRKISKVIE